MYDITNKSLDTVKKEIDEKIQQKLEERQSGKKIGKLPRLASIDFELVKMSIAPPNILEYNSKQNLEKRTH